MNYYPYKFPFFLFQNHTRVLNHLTPIAPIYHTAPTAAAQQAAAANMAVIQSKNLTRYDGHISASCHAMFALVSGCIM